MQKRLIVEKTERISATTFDGTKGREKSRAEFDMSRASEFGPQTPSGRYKTDRNFVNR